MSGRSTTPPPGRLPGVALPLTPDAKRQIEENRLRAKARLQAQERSTTIPSSSQNAFNKRPLEVISAGSRSPTNPNVRSFPSKANQGAGKASAALQSATGSTGPAPGYSRDGRGPKASTSNQPYGHEDPNKPLPNRIGKFVEYDLSTLKNSKGGFLVDEEEDDERVLKERRQLEELKKQRQRQAQRTQEPNLTLEPNVNPKCKICGTVELDFQIHKVFGVAVCHRCKNENPDRFSLLTKTECKEDYLLTDPELKDAELLPHLLKPNPHRSTYSNMMLFLREQVEAFAFSPAKWGSPEALDEEFEKRQAEKKRKKGKKFEEKLKQLRRRTMSNVWHKKQDEEHVHEFVTSVDTKGTEVQRCEGCGLTVECETF